MYQVTAHVYNLATVNWVIVNGSSIFKSKILTIFYFSHNRHDKKHAMYKQGNEKNQITYNSVLKDGQYPAKLIINCLKQNRNYTPVKCCS